MILLSDFPRNFLGDFLRSHARVLVRGFAGCSPGISAVKLSCVLAANHRFEACNEITAGLIQARFPQVDRGAKRRRVSRRNAITINSVPRIQFRKHVRFLFARKYEFNSTSCLSLACLRTATRLAKIALSTLELPPVATLCSVLSAREETADLCEGSARMGEAWRLLLER